MPNEEYCIVRRYRDKYKLSVLHNYNPDRFIGKKGTGNNEDKLEQSISRAKKKIFEYAYCNDWDYFVTMTLDPKKYDRFNLKEWHKDLTHWLRNYKRRIDNKIAYLLVPEQHEDGAWHIHGLLHGLPITELHQFQIGDIMGKKLAKKVMKGDTVYNWPLYQKKYGFVSLEAVKCHEAVSKYVTKYITKDMARLNNELNAHLYYCSQGLQVSEVMAQHMVYTSGFDISADYDTKYCSVKWYDDISSAFKVFMYNNLVAEQDYEWEEIAV